LQLDAGYTTSNGLAYNYAPYSLNLI
jgi:hypothetical protein